MNDIEKNRLDLAYKRQLCFLNFLLIIGVGSIISLIVGLLINLEKWLNYLIAFVIIGITIYLFYKKVDFLVSNITLTTDFIKKLVSLLKEHIWFQCHLEIYLLCDSII